MAQNLNDSFLQVASIMRTPSKTPKTAAEIGLSTSKVLKTSKEFFQFIDLAVVQYLDINPADATLFSKTLTAYLLELGITSEKSFAMMKEFPAPTGPLKRTNSNGDAEELESAPISFLIRQALTDLARVSKTVGVEKYFMEDASKIDMISEWADHVVALPTDKTSTPASATTVDAIATNTRKFPSFVLKKFVTYEGEVAEFLDDIKTDFTEKKVVSFLDDESYANQHLDTSKAYCLTLFKALSGSPFNYLKSEYHDKIENSAKLWIKFNEILTTNVSEMAAVDAAWSKIHHLNCKDLDTFEMFYSDYVTAENKLIELKSIAIKDNSFLRSLLFHKIDVEDLKSETSQLILNKLDTSVRDILENLKKKAKALSINLNGDSTTRARKAGASSYPSKKPKNSDKFTKNKVTFGPRFPANKGNHIPEWAYGQMKQWYYIMSKPHTERSEEELKTLSKFVFTLPKGNARNDASTKYPKRNARKLKKEKEAENERKPAAVPPPPPPPPPQHDRDTRYNDDHYYQQENHWNQQQLPDSYARRSHSNGYGFNGGHNPPNRYHPSGYGRGRGGSGRGRW